MESYELFGAVGILRESIELLPKNGRLMALLTVFNLALSSIFLSIFSFSTKSLLLDMFVKESFLPISSTDSSEHSSLLAGIKEDLGLFLLTYVAFLLAYFITSLFSTIATILLSALSYSGKTLSIKNLLLKVIKSWTRPLLTGFYTMLLLTGYFFFVFSMAIPIPLLMYPSRSALSLAILLGMLAYIFYLYLAVVWVLALVVSVIEDDCYGIEALGKAGRLVKGKRLHGFVLNILFNLTALILFLGVGIIRRQKWLVNPTAIAFFTLSFSCLLKIFQLVAFTVFYFHCKNNHGEEIELQGSIDSLEYSKISGAPLFNDVLP